MFTRFTDMHSGGGIKESPYEFIYIEAGEDEAEVIFYNRFGHAPRRVSCTCCGSDYSISEHESLELATAYDRGCSWNSQNKYSLETAAVPIEDYCKRQDVLVIRCDEISDDERVGDVPEEGYVWVD